MEGGEGGRVAACMHACYTPIMVRRVDGHEARKKRIPHHEGGLSLSCQVEPPVPRSIVGMRTPLLSVVYGVRCGVCPGRSGGDGGDGGGGGQQVYSAFVSPKQSLCSQ